MHEGSGLGRSVADITKLCPRSTVRDGLAIGGREARKSQNKVSEWLRELEAYDWDMRMKVSLQKIFFPHHAITMVGNLFLPGNLDNTRPPKLLSN